MLTPNDFDIILFMSYLFQLNSVIHIIMPTNDSFGTLSTDADRQQPIIERGLFQAVDLDINDSFWAIAMIPPPPINPQHGLFENHRLISRPQIWRLSLRFRVMNLGVLRLFPWIP